MYSIAIGSYTSNQGHVPQAKGEGISFLSLDGGGRLSQLRPPLNCDNPSWVQWNPGNKVLASGSEADAGGQLQLHNLHSMNAIESSTGPIIPESQYCHLCFFNNGNSIAALSYNAGSIDIYDIQDLTPFHRSRSTFEGSGPNKDRQESSHAHQGFIGPGGLLYVCDLGSDVVWSYNLQNGEIRAVLRTPPGYGPRHLAFDPQINTAYILCELEPRIITADCSGKDWTILQDISSSPMEFDGLKSPAAIKIHPSGKTLAASNRFCDSIAMFSISRENSEQKILDFMYEFPCGGKTPRDIEFSPDGRYFLAANQDSHNIAVFFCDPDSGKIAESSISYDIGSPVCIQFLITE